VSAASQQGLALCRIVLYTVLFSTFFLISKGLSVTRPTLRAQEWALAALMVTFILAVVAGVEFSEVDVFLLYVVYVMYLVVMGVIVSGVNRNVRFLRACFRLVWLAEQQNHGRVDERALRGLPGFVKLRILRTLLIVVFAYIVAGFVVQFSVSFDAEFPWVGDLLKYASDWCVVAALLVVMRPRESPEVFPGRDVLSDQQTFEAFFQQPRIGVDLMGDLDDARLRESIQALVRQRRGDQGGGGDRNGPEEPGEPGAPPRKYLAVVMPHAEGRDGGRADIHDWYRAAVEVLEEDSAGKEDGTGGSGPPVDAPAAAQGEPGERVLRLGSGDGEASGELGRGVVAVPGTPSTGSHPRRVAPGARRDRDGTPRRRGPRSAGNSADAPVPRGPRAGDGHATPRRSRGGPGTPRRSQGPPGTPASRVTVDDIDGPHLV